MNYQRKTKNELCEMLEAQNEIIERLKKENMDLRIEISEMMRNRVPVMRAIDKPRVKICNRSEIKY